MATRQQHSSRYVRICACNRTSGLFRDMVLSMMHKRVPVVDEDARNRVKVRIGEWEIWLDRNEYT